MDQGWLTPARPDLVATSVPAGHWLRTPTVAVSTVGLGLGLATQAVGGEGLPRVETVVFLAVVTGLLWSNLAKTAEDSLPRMVVGVGSVQLALHVALLEHQHSEHQHQHSGQHFSGRQAGSGAEVTAAHAVAAFLLAWLGRGTVAFWRVARRVLGRMVGRLGPTLAPLATPKPVPPVVRPVRPRPRYVLLAAPRRGPPLPA